MSYINMDHAAWAARNWKRELTPFQARVANIIGIVGNGIYNAPISRKIDWEYGRGVSVLWRRDMATFDFDELTRLVLLCHEARIRVDIAPCNPQYLRVSFWQRDALGGVSHRHPSIQEAIERWTLPPDHMLRWENHPERKGGAA